MKYTLTSTINHRLVESVAHASTFKHHFLSRGNDDREIEERSGMAFHVYVKMFLFTFYQISVLNTPTGHTRWRWYQ